MPNDYSMKLLVATLILTFTNTVFADSDNDDYVEFNPIFISRGSAQSIDLKRYAYDLPAIGTYLSDIVVNGKVIGKGEITIKDREDMDNKVAVCVSRSVLSTLELNYDKLTPEGKRYFDKASQSDCVNIEQVLANAPTTKVVFDANSLSLNLDIPQALRIERPRDYVNPELWDQGITAATLGYNMNYTRTRVNGKQLDSFFNYLNGGINLAGFHFRHDGNYSWRQRNGGSYRSLNNYVERDIPLIGGKVVFGDANTKGELFDTIAFRGVKIENEEQMLPYSLRGYAPIIRGTAQTTAKVVIKQNGHLIYEKMVAPGPFEINDLYPTGYGGNLDVAIEEADGTVQNIQVPYSSMTSMLRPGKHKYSFTHGKARKTEIAEQPLFTEATYQRGINNRLTMYGGAQGNNDYQALQGGIAVGTLLGAISFDVTHAKTKLDDEVNSHRYSLSGQSYQIKYSQNITQTKSNFSLAAYRFSTHNYLDFRGGMHAREIARKGFDAGQMLKAKSRFTLTANQQLPDGWGQFYISAYSQNYWNKANSDRQYQLGYSNFYKDIGYNFNISRNRSLIGEYDNIYQLSLSVPLGKRNVFSQMGVNLTRGAGNSLTEQLFLNGTAGENNDYSYGMTVSNTNKNGGTSGSVSGSTRSQFATFNGLMGKGSGYETYSLGMSGALIAHSKGITASPYSAETYALVEAIGAEGAKVSSYNGIRINRFGYAVVPYLSAYQMNEISIDPRGSSESVELNNTSQKVAPYRGAVIKVKYGTVIGYPVLITAKLANGQSVPFGADVYDMAGNRIGAVGQGSRLFARVPSEQSSLKVSWGSSTSQQCQISYMLPKQVNLKEANTLKFTSVCQ